MALRTSSALLAIFLMASCVKRGEEKAAPPAGNAPGDNGGGEVSAVSDLTPTRIVLYQNGIGYVERRGKVEGRTLHLRVREQQVNDILKSLTIVDAAKGKALSIALPVDKSADRLTRELPKAIRDQGGLVALLAVFRGAQVSIATRDGTYQGRVLGVEDRTELSADGKPVQKWHVTLFDTSGKLVPVDVGRIDGVTLQDKTLEVGLRKSLDISLGAGAWKPVELTVTLTEGSHDLLVSYIAEMPVWKPSYRLVVGDDGRALVQGWAIVDNVTGEDWRGVSLSLVAGEPLSFTYDLHTPLFRERPHIAQRVHNETTPTSNTEAFGWADKSRALAAPKASAGAAPMEAAAREEKEDAAPSADAPMAEPAPPPPPEISAEAMRDSVQTLVSGTQVGALFRYDIADKVDVPDRSSALVSILSKDVPGEDVHLFRPDSSSAFNDLKPHRAVRFTNETGFALEQGPIALYRGSTFVGEGFIDRVAENAPTFVPYAIDDEVRLDATTSEKEEGLRILKIVDGTITSEIKRVNRVTYAVRNLRAEAVSVWIRRAKRPGWKLDKPTEGVLEAPDGWLYLPVKVAAKGQAELSVEESTPVERQVGIKSDLSGELLEAYIGSSSADEKLKGPIQEVLGIKKRLNALGKEIGAVAVKKGLFEDTQSRVRANLDQLNDTKGNEDLKRDQTKKLAEADNEISKLVGQLVKLNDEKAQLESKLVVLFEAIHL